MEWVNTNWWHHAVEHRKWWLYLKVGQSRACIFPEVREGKSLWEVSQAYFICTAQQKIILKKTERNAKWKIICNLQNQNKALMKSIIKLVSIRGVNFFRGQGEGWKLGLTVIRSPFSGFVLYHFKTVNFGLLGGGDGPSACPWSIQIRSDTSDELSR